MKQEGRGQQDRCSRFRENKKADSGTKRTRRVLVVFSRGGAAVVRYYVVLFRLSSGTGFVGFVG